MSNSNINFKMSSNPQLNNLSQRLSYLFGRSNASAATPSQFRYVKARDTMNGAKDADLRFDATPALTGLVVTTDSLPATLVTPATSVFSGSDASLLGSPISSGGSYTSSPSSTSAPSPSRTDVESPSAMPMAALKSTCPPSSPRGIPQREQSIFDWSPDNSPKAKRSYMHDFLGSASAASQARSRSHSRHFSETHNTTSGDHRSMQRKRSSFTAPLAVPCDVPAVSNTVNGRNRKGSVSALILPSDLSPEFLDATREIEVVARRARRLSSIDTNGGSDLEGRLPVTSTVRLVSSPGRPPLEGLQMPASSVKGRNIPLPIFEQATLRELRSRSRSRKPDGSSLPVASKKAATDTFESATPVNKVSPLSTLDSVTSSPSSAAINSPTIPSRGGSLPKKFSKACQHLSPIASPFREDEDPMKSLVAKNDLRDTDTLRTSSDKVEEGLLFSSLKPHLPLSLRVEREESTDRSSCYLDLSADIMATLDSFEGAGSQRLDRRKRGDTISSMSSDYSSNGNLPPISMGRQRKNSIIALPPSDWEATPPLSPTLSTPAPLAHSLRRAGAPMTRPRRGSALQRLKDEETRSAGRNRKGSILSIYSTASAEIDELLEEKDEEDIKNFTSHPVDGEGCDKSEKLDAHPMLYRCTSTTELSSSPTPSLDSLNAAGLAAAGRRMSNFPSPIHPGAYQDGLTKSRPVSLMLPDDSASRSRNSSLSSSTFGWALSTPSIAPSSTSTPALDTSVWGWGSDSTGMHVPPRRGSKRVSSFSTHSSLSIGGGLTVTSVTSVPSTPPTPCSPLLVPQTQRRGGKATQEWYA